MKVLDLFSGVGGFSLGLERTGGFETVAFCEIEEFPRKVLEKHWPNVPIHKDIRELKGVQLGQIDVICGGFPCQDISASGKGAGLSGERSGLWSEYLRLIDEVGPSWVIIENVPTLRCRGLSTVLQNISEIGYDAEWHCIPASYIGAAHSRDRIWVIAYPSGSRGGVAVLRDHRQGRGDPHAPQSAVDVQAVGTGSPKECRTRNVLSAWATIFGRRQPKPFVEDVADGIPGRVANALGNTVQPQLPEIIGRAILACS